MNVLHTTSHSRDQYYFYSAVKKRFPEGTEPHQIAQESLFSSSVYHTTLNQLKHLYPANLTSLVTHKHTACGSFLLYLSKRCIWYVNGSSLPDSLSLKNCSVVKLSNGKFKWRYFRRKSLSWCCLFISLKQNPERGWP